MESLKEFLRAILDLPILKSAGFYFGLLGLAITFGPRFGITFSQAEIGQVMMFIGFIFGVSPPTVQYLQLKLYEARVKAERMSVKEQK